MEAKVKTNDQAERFSLMGVEVRVRAGASDTKGAFSALEQLVAPGAGSPPHTVEQDKTILVLDGRVALTVGSETRPEGPGAIAFIPRGVVHDFKNVGDGPARILVLMTPGGHEAFLRDASSASGPAAFAEVCARHHVQLGSR